MAMRRLFVSASCLLAVLCGCATCGAQDLTNWIRPYNFSTPNLEGGQYAFQAGVALDGQKSKQDFRLNDEPFWSKATSDQYSFSTRFLYALSDRWAMAPNITFIPGQSEQKSTTNQPSEFVRTVSEYDLKPSYNVSVTLTYKPTPVLELFGTGYYNRSKRESDSDRKSTGEYYHVFFGFNTGR